MKLSLDQHSDSSFNNVSIKSADKHNSVVGRLAANILSSKTNALNNKNQQLNQIYNQISPTSYSNNDGGKDANSIIHKLNLAAVGSSSQSSVYSSHFSNNSRFTNARPVS